MSEAVQTLEGWYALHDFRAIDWNAWKRASAEERAKAEDELYTLLAQWNEIEQQKQGSTAFYTVVDVAESRPWLPKKRPFVPPLTPGTKRCSRVASIFLHTRYCANS